MNSVATSALSRARAALLTATLAALTWNLASLGAAVNGREALAAAFDAGPLTLALRLGLSAATLAAAGVAEIAAIGAGVVTFRTRGIARLQLGAAALLLPIAAGVATALVAAGDDARALHEVARRALGTTLGAGAASVSLAAIALFAYQALEAASAFGRGRLSALVGFAVGFAIFALGLWALVPLASGGPLLPV